MFKDAKIQFTFHTKYNASSIQDFIDQLNDAKDYVWWRLNQLPASIMSPVNLCL